MKVNKSIATRLAGAASVAVLASALSPTAALAEETVSGVDLLIPKMGEFIPALIGFVVIWVVLAKYKSVVDVKAATVPVEVTTAMPLDEELRASIIRKMTSELGKPVYLMEHVDPAIIGGLVLEVGDELRDASIRTQLENMRQTLTNPSVGGDGK